MLFTVDTSQPLSDFDREILHRLMHDGGEWPEVEQSIDAKTKAPTKKAAKAPKKAAEPAEASTPAPATPEAAQDAPTLDDAVAKASEAIADNRADDVRAALRALDAKRVSELAGDDVAKFIGAL